MMKKPKKPIRGLVLDLDDALYYSTPDWQTDWAHSWAKAVLLQKIDMSFDDALALIWHIYKDRGHAQQGLADHLGIDGWKLHQDAITFMDHNKIEPCVITRAHFERYRNVPMVILTHGIPEWAERMLGHIMLDDIIPESHRITLCDTNGLLKSHHDDVFHMAAERLGIPVDELAMADDSARNLIIPHRLGMTTIQITHDHPQKEQPSHVDLRVDKAYHIFEHMEQGLIPWHRPATPAPHSLPSMALSR